MQKLDVEDVINGEDFVNAIQILRWLFQTAGIWPIKSASYPPYIRRIAILMSIWSAFFLIIPTTWSVIREKNGFAARLQMAGPIVFCITNYFKFIAFLIKENQFYTYLINVALDWHEMKNKSRDRLIMLKKTEISRLYMKCCSIGMYLSGTLFNLLLPLAQPPLQIGNETIRNLPLTAYYKYFDQYEDAYYCMIFAMQYICSLLLYAVVCGFCCISIQSILHISGRCDITLLMIKDLNENFDDNSLKAIVKFQMQSLKFATDIEDLLNEMFLAEFMGSTFTICFLGYYALMNMDDIVGAGTFILLLITFIFNIYIFCYLGEHLTEQCESVGEAVYMIDWFNLPVKKSRDLFLVTMFCQRPVYITAGKMVNFSHFSFASLIKGSAAYLNFIYNKS